MRTTCQVLLGFPLHDLPSPGFLHGVNALLVFIAAVAAGRPARTREPVTAPDAQVAGG